MPFTAEELEAMRIADAEISKWLDDLAANDTLDHKQLHNKRYRRAYYARKKNAAPDTAIVGSGT